MTRVINIKNAPIGWRQDPHYVYIGRPSLYENPYAIVEPIEDDDGCSREDAIALCRADFEKNKPLQQLVIKNLLFKILICYCSPKPCHGNIYVEFLDKYINKPGFEKENKNGFFD